MTAGGHQGPADELNPIHVRGYGARPSPRTEPPRRLSAAAPQLCNKRRLFGRPS
jgi:hypothetical protein